MAGVNWAGVADLCGIGRRFTCLQRDSCGPRRSITTGGKLARLVICLTLASTVALLGGCGTVFDPAPYNPRNDDKRVLNKLPPPSTAVTVVNFTDPLDSDPLGHASQKLQALSDGYASERDDMMRQQLLFDIPMLGLGAAAIINPLFDGAKAATLGLSLGAAAAGGGRLYFGPQTKVAAYNAASVSLGCGASAAATIAGEAAIDAADGAALAERMDANAALAAPLVSGNATLLTARDQAMKSLDALRTALATLRGAPATLQAFAVGVISSTTTKIVTSIQNVDNSIKLIADAATKKPAASAGIRTTLLVTPAQPTAAQLIRDLQEEAALADAVTQRVNAAFSLLAKCALTS